MLKNAPPEELAHAVRGVAAGDSVLAPSVTRRSSNRPSYSFSWRIFEQNYSIMMSALSCHDVTDALPLWQFLAACFAVPFLKCLVGYVALD